MKIEEFFQNEYIQFANVDNYQNIASYIDGFKPTARKLFYTYYYIVKSGLIKTAQISSKMAELCNYLGGENSANGVVVNLAKDFIGSNNIPIFNRKGHFGTRFFPNSAAAPRYIFIKENPIIKQIFKQEDYPILIEQIFEGDKIEPRFFVPIIPMILVNGSEGIGTGFAQKILPRNPIDIVNQLIEYLEGKRKQFDLIPYYKGLNCKIEQNGTNDSWIIYPLIKQLESKRGYTKYQLLDAPFALNKLLEKLDKAIEKKIIVDYEDKSDNDKYNIIIKVKSNITIDKLIDKLSLALKITENYTSMDEENKIIEFKSIQELLEKYIEIRLQYYDKRIQYILNQLLEEYDFLKDKYKFIKAILDKKLIINKKSKDNIIQQCKKLDIKYSEEHLRMQLMSLTKEKLIELKNQAKQLKEKINYYKTITNKELWLKELKELKEILK